VLPRNAEPHKKLGELRRMLAVLEVTRLPIAALHQWMDDAQRELGELHKLIHRTWFEPSTSSTGQTAVTGQSQAQSHAPAPLAAKA
jgi:hypothetical protein